MAPGPTEKGNAVPSDPTIGSLAGMKPRPTAIEALERRALP
jgi:hypothetical protein